MSERTLKMDGASIDPEHLDWFDAWKRPVKIEATSLPIPFEVETLEGTMEASGGDVLIRGVEDELYPCDEDIFSQTYLRNGHKVPKYSDDDINVTMRKFRNNTLDHLPIGVINTDARSGVRAFIDLLEENAK